MFKINKLCIILCCIIPDCACSIINYGVGFSNRLSKSQNYSPVKGLTNYYHATKKRIKTHFVGLSTDYLFNIKNNYFTSFGVGIEWDYIDYGKLKGVLHPGVNIKPNSDTLSYSFSSVSNLLVLNGKFASNNRIWLPYIFLGIGRGFNKLDNYHEKPIHDNRAAPSQKLYKMKTKKNIAYSMGMGLYRDKISHDISFNVEYRFIYSGNSVLKNPALGSRRISFGALSAHFIALSLDFF